MVNKLKISQAIESLTRYLDACGDLDVEMADAREIAWREN